MTTFPYVKDNGNRVLKKLKVDMIMELGNNILDKVDKEFNLKKYIQKIFFTKNVNIHIGVSLSQLEVSGGMAEGN